MVSLQEPGTMRWYRLTPNGARILLMKASVGVFAPAGGAPDGALASVKTPDQLTHIEPAKGLRGTPGAYAVSDESKILKVDDFLLVTFQAVGSDTWQVADSHWSIPIYVQGQGVTFLGQADFKKDDGVTALADLALVAGVETNIARKKITEGRVAFGGGAIFADIQDDT